MLKVLRFIGLSSLVIVLGLSIFTTSYLYLSPQFGASPSEEQKEQYRKTNHYEEDSWINLVETNMAAPDMEVMLDFFGADLKRVPSKNIDVLKLCSLEI